MSKIIWGFFLGSFMRTKGVFFENHSLWETLEKIQTKKKGGKKPPTYIKLKSFKNYLLTDLLGSLADVFLKLKARGLAVAL